MSQTLLVDVNFDGLVGPTHNYAGLSFGNLASTRNRQAISSPRDAALQGLEKMHWLMTLGVPQAVLPPLFRPHFSTLRRLGFGGSDAQVLDRAWRTAPDLFAACCSASSMWTANAATVAPSCDTLTGKLHLTPANLLANFHRSIEAADTCALLRALFADTEFFQVAEPLPAFAGLSDEGAANHLRLGDATQGLHLFVYGTDPRQPETATRRFPARQTLAASRAVARLNGLPEERVLFVRQAPEAIDAGAFHNDVVAVSHRHLLLCHERAFVNQKQVLAGVRKRLSGAPLELIQIRDSDVPLADAVSSYLFNSQIVTASAADGERHWLLLPLECQENPRVLACVQRRVDDSPSLHGCHFVDVRQSMRNGGGPACLRLRVPMNARERDALRGRAWLTPSRYEQLKAHIRATYPDQLRLEDLRSVALCEALRDSVCELWRILGLVPPSA